MGCRLRNTRWAAAFFFSWNKPFEYVLDKNSIQTLTVVLFFWFFHDLPISGMPMRETCTSLTFEKRCRILKNIGLFLKRGQHKTVSWHHRHTFDVTTFYEVIEKPITVPIRKPNRVRVSDSTRIRVSNSSMFRMVETSLDCFIVIKKYFIHVKTV
jgi:hypothetical protein